MRNQETLIEVPSLSLTSCVTLASCFTKLSLDSLYVNSNSPNSMLTLLQTLNGIALIKPLAKFTEHQKQLRNVNSLVFDDNDINIVITN